MADPPSAVEAPEEAFTAAPAASAPSPEPEQLAVVEGLVEEDLPPMTHAAQSAAAKAQEARETKAREAAAALEKRIFEQRKAYNERQRAELEARAEAEANEKRNVVAEAEAERNLFYSQRAKQLEATKAANRGAQKAAVEAAAAPPAGGNVWEKVAALTEPSAEEQHKGKPAKQGEGVHKTDLSKYKSLLVRLKTQPPKGVKA